MKIKNLGLMAVTAIMIAATASQATANPGWGGGGCYRGGGYGYHGGWGGGGYAYRGGNWGGGCYRGGWGGGWNNGWNGYGWGALAGVAAGAVVAGALAAPYYAPTYYYPTVGYSQPVVQQVIVPQRQVVVQHVDSVLAKVQSKLAALGYYKGGIDGTFGPQTSAAVQQYQADNGIPVTGRLDNQTMAALGAK